MEVAVDAVGHLDSTRSPIGGFEPGILAFKALKSAQKLEILAETGRFRTISGVFEVKSSLSSGHMLCGRTQKRTKSAGLLTGPKALRSAGTTKGSLNLKDNGH